MAAASQLTLDYACKTGSTHSFKEVTVAKFDAATILGHVLVALCQNDKVHVDPGNVNTCRLKLSDSKDEMKYDDRVVLTKDHLDTTIKHGLVNGECSCPDKGARIGHLAVQYLVVVSTMFCIGADILNVTPQTLDHAGCRDDLVTLFTSEEAFATKADSMLGFIKEKVTTPTCVDVQINDTSLTVKLRNPDGPPIVQDLTALCISPIMTVLILLNFVMSDAVDRLKNQAFSPKDQHKWDAFVNDALCDKGPTASVQSSPAATQPLQAQAQPPQAQTPQAQTPPLQSPSVPPPGAGPQQAEVNMLSDDDNA